MTSDEQAQLGEFAGRTVDTGPEAEAFARYIGGHLAEVNEGKTYSETSAAARQEGFDPETAADLQAKGGHAVQGRYAAIDPVERVRLVDDGDDSPCTWASR